MTIVGNGVWIRFMFRVLADDRPAGTVHAGPSAALRGLKKLKANMMNIAELTTTSVQRP